MAQNWPECSVCMCAFPAALTSPSSGWAPPPHCCGGSTGWWGWRKPRLSSPLRAAASAQGHAVGSDQTTKLLEIHKHWQMLQLWHRKKKEWKRKCTSSALRARMACLRTELSGLFSAFSSANLFSRAKTLFSTPWMRQMCVTYKTKTQPHNYMSL